MLMRLRRVAFALFLLFAAIQAVPYRVVAQDSAPQQESKRKVKKRVEPVYPDLAKRMSLTGKVRIQVVINPEGRITSTKELGGSPVLVAAAEQALKQWSFEPGPNETTEVVEFDFAGDSN